MPPKFTHFPKETKQEIIFGSLDINSNEFTLLDDKGQPEMTKTLTRIGTTTQNK